MFDFIQNAAAQNKLSFSEAVRRLVVAGIAHIQEGKT